MENLNEKIISYNDDFFTKTEQKIIHDYCLSAGYHYGEIDGPADPISGMTLHITKKGKLKKLEIQGKTIDLNKIYNVATSDYLYNGGDRMEFFKKSKTVFDFS